MADPELPQRILVIDDDPSDLKAFENYFAKNNIQPKLAKDWATAIYMFNQHPFDLTIIELDFSELSGLIIAQRFLNHDHENKRRTAHVISAGRKLSEHDKNLISEVGDIGIIAKPFNWVQIMPHLVNTVRSNNQRLQLLDLDTKVIQPLIKQNNVEKALKIAEEKVLPLGLRGHKMYVKLLEATGKSAQAISHLEKLVQTNPNELALRNALGRIYLNNGQIDLAKSMLEEADKLAPNNIQRVEHLAEFYLKTKKPEESIHQYKKLISFYPEDTGKKFDYVETIDSAGYTREAQDFCRSISTPMELIRHYNNKGVVFSKNNQLPQAIEEYRKAIRYASASKEIYKTMYNMALANINLKTTEHLQESEKLLIKCLEINKSFEKATEKLELVRSYMKSGKKVS